MKKQALLAVGLTFCMTLVMAAPAFAANVDANVNPDGTEVTLPGNPVYDTAGGGSTQETGMSYNQAEMTGTNGTDFYTENDDDAVAKDADTNGADINVWAKVTDSSSKIYKVDLAWGAMKFEFDSGSGQWDTTTHTYTGGSGAAKWTESYLDGTNNKVEVTNHSNSGINAAFAYAMTGTPFNDVDTSDNAVTGNFFKEINDAAVAATVLQNTFAGDTETANVLNKLTDSKISLATADKYNSSTVTATDAANNHEAGARTDSVYFAFSGTPDSGRGATLDTFRKVGVITVTVTPNTELQYNQPQYTP